MVTPPDDREWHVIMRARERYGVDLDRSDVLQLAAQIITGLSVVLSRGMPGGLERHLVRHGDVTMIVVYCPVKRMLVTALPPGYTTTWAKRKARRQVIAPT
jgi:hypothetical protein